jgi:hypothetical protein
VKTNANIAARACEIELNKYNDPLVDIEIGSILFSGERKYKLINVIIILKIKQATQSIFLIRLSLSDFIHVFKLILRDIIHP